MNVDISPLATTIVAEFPTIYLALLIEPIVYIKDNCEITVQAGCHIILHYESDIALIGEDHVAISPGDYTVVMPLV